MCHLLCVVDGVASSTLVCLVSSRGLWGAEVLESRVSTAAPLQRRSRSLLASPMSVSLSLVSWVNSGDVSGVDCCDDKVGETVTVYGMPRAGLITPVVRSGDSGGLGGELVAL